MITNTETLTRAKNKKRGFTLIEVIAVLVLLGILAAVAIPRYVDMSATARGRALDAAVAELNGREALVWGNSVIQAGGYAGDAAVFTLTNPTTAGQELGAEYTWGAVTAAGGTVTFQTVPRTLARTASTATSPANWQ